MNGSTHHNPRNSLQNEVLTCLALAEGRVGRFLLLSAICRIKDLWMPSMSKVYVPSVVRGREAERRLTR